MDPTPAELLALLLQVAMGISLAACAGLRAFLPMFVVGVAGKLELLTLSSSFEWLASWPALIVLGVAVVTELLADKFPVVDHFLDTVQTFVKPIAGTILVACVVGELPPLYATLLGLITGGGAATAVHLSKANVRLASTASTGGAANPLLSFLEDVAALLGSLASFVVPLLVLLLFAIGLFVVWRLARRARARVAAA